MVVRGKDNRDTLSIKTALTLIAGSIPDLILENILVVFTFTPSELQCTSHELLEKYMTYKQENCFYIDNIVFSMDPTKHTESDDDARERSWRLAMQEIVKIGDRAFNSQLTQRAEKDGFGALHRHRMAIRATFHQIKNNVSNLQKALDELEQAEIDIQKAKQRGEETKNYTATKMVTTKTLVDDNILRTLCSSCEQACHDPCGLSEISEAGSNAFKNCSAFCGRDNCRVCPKSCSYSTHYHARKKVVVVSHCH
jgi:hypothetical protein